MTLSITGGSAVSAAGTAGTASVVSNPTLPANTLSGDRVFIIAAAVGTMATPASWTQVSNSALGGGVAGAGTGTRNTAVWYRDYDGAWAMPTVTAASVASNSIAGCAVTMSKEQTDMWVTPLSTTGSDTTAGTGFSAAGSSTAFDAGIGVLLADSFPTTTTTASGSLTVTGGVFSALTNSVVSAGTTTGNAAAVAAWTCTVTTAATNTPTHALTLGGSVTGGTVFVAQQVLPVVPVRNLFNRARYRALLW